MHEVHQATHEVAAVVADGIGDSSEEVEEDVRGVERAQDGDVGGFQPCQQLSDERVPYGGQRHGEFRVVVPFRRAVFG